MKDRQAGVKRERKAALKKLKIYEKYEKIEFVLNSTQHDDLLGIVSIITDQCPQQVNTIFPKQMHMAKVISLGNCGKLWKKDVDDRLGFKKDQAKNRKCQRAGFQH